jgi:hypothetical protein
VPEHGGNVGNFKFSSERALPVTSPRPLPKREPPVFFVSAYAVRFVVIVVCESSLSAALGLTGRHNEMNSEMDRLREQIAELTLLQVELFVCRSIPPRRVFFAVQFGV